MNAIQACILSIIVLAIFSVPQRWALMAMMAGVLYLTQEQRVEILGFNLFAMRFVELAGFIRVTVRREFSFSRLNGIDRIFLLFYGYMTVVFLLRSNEGMAAEKIGAAIDAFLCYFTFRGLLATVQDLRWCLRAFLLLLVPYVGLVLIESFTNHNSFTSSGAYYASVLREGRMRASGTFRHPSLLGTLGGSFLPLYIGLWFGKNDRTLASTGIALCLAIVWASNSGGPASCVAVCLMGWLLWPARARMSLVRRVLFGIVILFALAMKAPVWYMLQRVSNVTGGDGWHRSHLLDMAFQNLDKWWLAGMPVQDTSTWFPYVMSNTGGADMTNQFLLYGITAGLGALFLFILLLTRAWRNLGETLAILRNNAETRRENEFFCWALGVLLAVHTFNWLGITYFDQTYVMWFMQLAFISTLTERIGTAEPEIVKVGSDRAAAFRYPLSPRLQR